MTIIPITFLFFVTPAPHYGIIVQDANTHCRRRQSLEPLQVKTELRTAAGKAMSETVPVRLSFFPAYSYMSCGYI